jgi:hypothetical protein
MVSQVSSKSKPFIRKTKDPTISIIVITLSSTPMEYLVGNIFSPTLISHSNMDSGPMIIHGPQSANYDVDVGTVLISDWSHETAFIDFFKELTTGPPLMQSNLLQGKGNLSYTPCLLT